MSNKAILLRLMRCGCGLIALASTQAMSQVGGSSQTPSTTPAEPNTSSASSSEQGGLEEIVVTAQKRSEKLQEVPIAIAAVTAQGLAQANVRSTVNLATVVPGLVTYQTVTSFQPFIRGVGSNISSIGLENPVAVYLDGVYLSSKAAAIFDLGAIERIEVIKGPQGTLFGRNATGGAISVVTHNPGRDPEFNGEIGYGRFGELLIKGSAAAPLSNTLRVMLSGSFRKDNGYIKDIVGGHTEGDVNQYAALGKILWSPSDRLDVEATYLQYKVDNNATNLRHHLPGRHIAFAPGVINATGNYQSSFDFVPIVRSKSRVALAKIRYGLSDGVDLVSISSYQHTDGLITVDADETSAHLAVNRQVEKGHSVSEELQLLSTGNSPLSWITGLYYFNSRPRTLPTEAGSGISYPYDPATLSGIPFVAPSVTRFYAKMPTKSYAAFAQLTYALSDADRITAGFRYTSDKKSLENQIYYVNKAGEEVAIAGRSSDTSKTFKKPTWRLSYDHKFSRDILGYISYNRGFKSGGYNPTVTGTPTTGQPSPVLPETLDAYEAGVKSELFDRRVRANISVFYYNYRSILVQTVNPITNLAQLGNAASARHYGVDVDLQAAVNENFSLRASATYLHAKYKDFKRAQIVVPGPTGAGIPAVVDAGGADVTYAPKFTATLGADYTIPVSDSSKVVLNSTYYYNSGFDLQPLGGILSLPSWSNLTASVTLHLADERYFIRAWGDNLTNDKHPIFKLGSAFGFDASYGKPITYGMAVGFKF